MSQGRGLARNEIGLAAINLTSTELHLCQMSDSHGFVKTLTKINLFRPNEVSSVSLSISASASPLSSLGRVASRFLAVERECVGILQNLPVRFSGILNNGQS